MAGIAIIVPGADFSQNNLGRVNLITEDTPLVYIRAGKTTYINTGILPSKDYAYEIKQKSETISQQLGARNDGKTPNGQLYCYNNGNGGFRPSGLNNIAVTGGVVGVILTLHWNLDFSFVVTNESNETVGSGNYTQAQYDSFSDIDCPLYLFAVNKNNTPANVEYRCSIYYFKIKDSQGNVIHNFVPYLSVMGVPYFLDTVTNEKYYFTAGTDDIFYSIDGVNEVTYKMSEV